MKRTGLKELKYRKELDGTGSSHIIEYLHYGSGGLSQGERIEYYKDGIIFHRGFCKDSCWFGKHYMYLKGSGIVLEEFYSIRNPGELITEDEYKKELYLFRIGEIERPEFFYLLKDYRHDNKII